MVLKTLEIFPRESNETSLEARLGQRISENDSVSKFDFGLRATEMVGNDSFPRQRMFGEVSKPLSAKISEILNIGPKFKLGCLSNMELDIILSKIEIL